MTKLCISFSNRAKFKHFAHVANLARSTGVLAECRPRLDIGGYLLHFALFWLHFASRWLHYASLSYININRSGNEAPIKPPQTEKPAKKIRGSDTK